MEKGFIVLFEGNEGSGKSGVIKHIYEKLTSLGYSLVVTKEPGHDNEKGRAIRAKLLDPKSKLTVEEELGLFFECREDHFLQIVGPAVLKGSIVLIDRSSASTIAYQCFGRQLGLRPDILARDKQARQGFDFDLVIWLDVDPVTGLKRKKDSGEAETRFEQEEIAFHERVRAGYEWQFNNNREKWVRIDTTLLSRSEVAAEVLANIIYKIYP